MAKIITIIVFIFLCLIGITFAGIVPECPEGRCTLQHFKQVFDNFLEGFLQLAYGLAFILVLAGSGIYMFGGAQPRMAEKGKKMIISAIIGFVIVLSAGIMIDLILEIFQPKLAPVGSNLLIAYAQEDVGKFYQPLRDKILSKLQCGQGATSTLDRIWKCIFEAVDLLKDLALVLFAGAIVVSGLYLISTPVFGTKYLDTAKKILIWASIGFVVIFTADLIRQQIEKVIQGESMLPVAYAQQSSCSLGDIQVNVRGTYQGELGKECSVHCYQAKAPPEGPFLSATVHISGDDCQAEIPFADRYFSKYLVYFKFLRLTPTQPPPPLNDRKAIDKELRNPDYYIKAKDINTGVASRGKSIDSGAWQVIVGLYKLEDPNLEYYLLVDWKISSLYIMSQTGNCENWENSNLVKNACRIYESSETNVTVTTTITTTPIAILPPGIKEKPPSGYETVSITDLLSPDPDKNPIARFLLNNAPYLLVVLLVIGGFFYLLAPTGFEKVQRGHKIIQYAVIGYIFVLVTAVVLSLIKAIFGVK